MKCTCLTRSDEPGLEHMDHCAFSKKDNVLVFRNPETNQPVAVPKEVVLQAERPYRAYQQHLAGFTWSQIAAQEQYADAAAAQYDVSRYLDEGRALVADSHKRDLLMTEVQRINTLQAAIWPQAMSGHLPAIRSVLDLIITRAKFLGLESASLAVEDSDTTAPRTVIVPNDTQGYQDALRRAAGDA